MKRLLILLGVLLSFHFTSFGQVISFPVSVLSDFIYTPMEMHDATVYSDFGMPDNVKIPFQYLQFNIVTLGLGYRDNLKELNNNSALAYDASINFGLGVMNQIYGEENKTHDISIQVPIMLKWYTGKSSTDLSKNKFGYSFGFGLEFNKIGLLYSRTDHPYNQAFLVPCASIGVIYTRNRNGRPSTREFNLKIGLGKINRTSVNGLGRTFRDKEYENRRATTVKFSIIFMPFD